MYFYVKIGVEVVKEGIDFLCEVVGDFYLFGDGEVMINVLIVVGVICFMVLVLLLMINGNFKDGDKVVVIGLV